MSDEQDSWFKDAFGLDVSGAAKKIADEAREAAGKVQGVVQRVQGAVEGAIDDVTGAVTGIVKKVAETAGGAVGGGAGGGGSPKGAAPSGGGTGSFPLSGSVGRGGQNGAGDVKAVQKALGIGLDGQCGPQTIAAIEAFQRWIGQAKPDGRVDAGGATERALASGGKPAGASDSTDAADDGGLLGGLPKGAGAQFLGFEDLGDKLVDFARALVAGGDAKSWSELAPLCEKFLDEHRFKAVQSEAIVPGDMPRDMYLDDRLIEVRAMTASGSAAICERLVTAFPDLKNYPIELADLVRKRWEFETSPNRMVLQSLPKAPPKPPPNGVLRRKSDGKIYWDPNPAQVTIANAKAPAPMSWIKGYFDFYVVDLADGAARELSKSCTFNSEETITDAVLDTMSAQAGLADYALDRGAASAELERRLEAKRTPQRPTDNPDPGNTPPSKTQVHQVGELKIVPVAFEFSYEKDDGKIKRKSTQKGYIEFAVESKPLLTRETRSLTLNFGTFEANYALGLAGKRGTGQKLKLVVDTELGASFTIVDIKLVGDNPQIPELAKVTLKMSVTVNPVAGEVEVKPELEFNVPVGKFGGIEVTLEGFPGKGVGIKIGFPFDVTDPILRKQDQKQK